MTASTIVHLDFRDATADECEQEVGTRLRTRDKVRVLVVDRVATLVDHDPAYRAIWASKLAEQVVCVAVGPPADRDAGVAVRATRVLDNQTALTLWVGDVEGDAELHTLLDLLRLPAVFERVVGLADQFPGRVASPGHRVIAGQVTPDELTDARRAAVRTITSGGGRTRGGLDAGYRDILAPDDPQVTELGWLRADSPLHKAFEDARRAYEKADRSVALLAGRFGPRLEDRGTRAWQDVAGVGTALAGLRDTLADLFTRIDGRAGLDQARWDELDEAGVLVDTPPDIDRAAVTERLRDHVVDGLDRGYPLSELVGWLRGVVNEATPTGSAARVAELDVACPAPVVDMLSKPVPFPWRASLPAALGAAAAGGFLAAFGPVGLLTGPLLVVAWVAAVVLAAARQPRPARAGRTTFVQHAVLWHLSVTGAGCVLGLAAADAVAMPQFAGLALTVVSVVELAAVSRVWWLRAVSAWAVVRELRRVPGVIDELGRVVRTVAVDEWAGSEPRRFVADAALTTVGALEAVATTLAGAGTDTPSGTSGVELRKLVVSDLMYAVRDAMRHCWDRLRVGAVDDVRAGVRDRLDDVLAEYARHLELRGIDEPFGEDTPARVALVDSLWRESPAVRDLLHDTQADRDVIQLCAPEDLSLLDQSTDGCRLIRIAPHAAQAMLGADRTTIEVTWTASGHIVGVLRLVALRGSAVALTWPVTAGEQEVR